MLRKVLYEISKSRLYSPSNIAKELNISEALVEDAIGQLIRMGYVSQDETSPTCDTKCSSCAYSSVCNTVTIKTLSITSKGKTLLEREASMV
ncbi:MAG: FeoC-like transcriptional regulator [Tissierellaceae bacterium]|nr:FeoC-like transcriptional regulator [Tissierellaceae bacterium]